MAFVTQWLSVLAPLILTILAMAFAISATTSKEWALQYHFNASDPLQVLQSNWSHPIFILYRSPFIICNDGMSCKKYKPFGFDRTSCELLYALQNDSLWNIGDARLCQQIHYAGNLAIASTTFIGIAFLLAIVMCIASVLFLTGSGSTDSAVHAPAANAEENVVNTGHKNHHNRHHARQSEQVGIIPRSKLGTSAPYLNLCLITSLILGALMYYIAQFYGVEGLVQSAPDNAAYADIGGYLGGTNGNTNHEPWIQGKALSIYATIAWLSCLLAAVAALNAWTLPKAANVF